MPEESYRGVPKKFEQNERSEVPMEYTELVGTKVIDLIAYDRMHAGRN